jgi:hypothetical protein
LKYSIPNYFKKSLELLEVRGKKKGGERIQTHSRPTNLTYKADLLLDNLQSQINLKKKKSSLRKYLQLAFFLRKQIYKNSYEMTCKLYRLKNI